jgi:hypothetical protein
MASVKDHRQKQPEIDVSTYARWIRLFMGVEDAKEFQNFLLRTICFTKQVFRFGMKTVKRNFQLLFPILFPINTK